MRLGWLRLGVFVATILITYKVFTTYGAAGFLPAIIGLASLLYLVSIDVVNNAKIRNTRMLIQINEEELRALNHQFGNREEGHHFLPKEHAYAADIDLFGPASIFQWLNRCYTEQGQTLLAQNLLHAQATELVLLRQDALKELTPMLDWRQQAQAFAMQKKITLATENRIQHWAAEEEKHFRHRGWKFVVIAYSFVTLSSAVAAMAGYIPGTIFSGLFLIYLITSVILSRNTVKPYVQLAGIVKEIAALQNFLSWFEKPSFTTPHLQTLQRSIKPELTSASLAIKKLKAILDRFDLRVSIVGVLFFNPFLLWDVRQMMALNRWRKENKTFLPLWFKAIAEVELLHSFSTLHFNEPQWCFPNLVTNDFTIDGTAIGHPLLPDAQRITNDFALKGKAKIDLITGSNMAGKSTFLRSLGVNVVLAQTGAPVCARSFTLSPVQLMSSMRIADNLAENTSTFYAELKKLRTVIEAVKTHEPLFILLDEILRGTNSFDRHKGSAALIQQLIKEDAVAVIATHDVELAQLEERYSSSVENYHFDVEVEGEELYFDYKLKPGVCRSINASLLMKKIGIEMTE
ncbi:MutS family DNA mismatch repair protein [Flavisolibacter ginsenosidimutans]|nr:MutS family DNA mismatch repair protein [Flavisolibacter ginsenosidimutans]